MKKVQLTREFVDTVNGTLEELYETFKHKNIQTGFHNREGGSVAVVKDRKILISLLEVWKYHQSGFNADDVLKTIFLHELGHILSDDEGLFKHNAEGKNQIKENEYMAWDFADEVRNKHKVLVSHNVWNQLKKEALESYKGGK